MSRAPRDVQAQHAVARPLVLIVLVLATWALAGSGSSVAKGEDASPEVPEYRSIVEEALAEYAAENYLEAMTLFVRAHELWPNARTLRGLGVVAFELHRYSESVSFLQQALNASEKRLEGEMRTDAERLLARARGFVAKISIVADPAGAQMRLDGEPSPRTAAGELLLDIGKHQLEFSAPGFDTQHVSYTVVGGEDLNWRVALRRAGTGPTSPQSGAPASPLLRWHKRLGAAAILVGTAGLASAGTFTARRNREGDRYRAVAPIDAEYENARRAWASTRARPYAFAGVGAVAFASGATGLLLRTPNRRLALVGAGIAAVVGTGLAAWGTVNLLAGGACDSPPKKQQSCSQSLERRDQGAITLLSAFPLVVAPLTLLVRHLLPRQPVSTLAMGSRFDLKQRSLAFDVRASW